jgi:PKD repeat protein
MGGTKLRRGALCLGVALLLLGLTSTSAFAWHGNSSFTMAPNPPNQGQPATFTCEPCPADEEVTVAWDIDPDAPGFERSGREVTYTYAEAGPVTVRMRLSHPEENPRIITRSFSVNGRPLVDFFYSPASPYPGTPIRFTASASDPEEDEIVSLVWHFGDGDMGSGWETVHHYDRAGTFTVSLTATDSGGASQTRTREVVVTTDPGPSASFVFSPQVPVAGRQTVFESTSQPSRGTITGLFWDFDGDDVFDDRDGSQVSWSFRGAGPHEVALMVRQSNGKVAIARRTIRINAPPVPGFTWDPFSPFANDWVDLVSTSSDEEGPLADQTWDLDGDGKFGDASGASVRYPFTQPGTYTVGLRVTDSDGVVRATTQQIVVQARPPDPGPDPGSPADPGGGSIPGTDPGAPDSPSDTPPAARPRPMSPFPIVRIAGAILERGTLIRVLSVRAPRGSRVRVLCRGKGCPVGSVARTSATSVTRFPRFERRLRAGIRLHLFVRQPGRIGKYTRFLIRAGAAPKRLDRCLFPGRRAPARCP